MPALRQVARSSGSFHLLVLCALQQASYNGAIRVFLAHTPDSITRMKIVHYPHPSLRHPTRPLTSIDNDVRIQAARMLELMYEAKGVGLATNQVFLSYQMFVMNPTADPEQRELERIYINPVIVERKGTTEGEEGCLSFPKLYQKVRRAKTIKVQGYNIHGEAVEEVYDDMASRICQHEIDHVHGILFIDKMGAIAKLAVRGTLKEFEREFRKAQQRGEIPPDEELDKKLNEPPPPEM